MRNFQINKYSSWQCCCMWHKNGSSARKTEEHSPLRFISKFFCYLLWAAECMSLRASNPQLQNTSLLLIKIHKTILGSLNWNGSLQVSGNIWMTVLSPQQWCLHSQHAPVQLHQGLWWHWTPHRSKTVMQCQVISAKSSNTCWNSLVRSTDWKYIPENQKVGKDPYKPNRPGKNWHLKIRVLMREKLK